MHTLLLSCHVFFPKIHSGPESEIQRERGWDLLWIMKENFGKLLNVIDFGNSSVAMLIIEYMKQVLISPTPSPSLQ